MDLSRKDFLKLTFAFLGGAALVQSGCGDSSGGPDLSTPPNCNLNGTKSKIADNHPAPHSLIVPKSDLASTTNKTYDIMGSADHTHSVTLTAANLASLAANTSVTVTSTSTLAHTHQCVVSCA